MNCTECKPDAAGNHESCCPFYLIPREQLPYSAIGWICPRCGRGNAPSCMTCPCVPMEYKVTSAL